MLTDAGITRGFKSGEVPEDSQGYAPQTALNAAADSAAPVCAANVTADAIRQALIGTLIDELDAMNALKNLGGKPRLQPAIDINEVVKDIFQLKKMIITYFERAGLPIPPECLGEVCRQTLNP